MSANDVTLGVDGARRFNGYLAQPPAEPRPGVVVLHDMFGLNEPIRGIADGLARKGFAALVPNVFWRSDIPGAVSYDDAQHVTAWERLKAIDLGVAAADIGTAVRWLRGQPFCNGKVGAVGFCGGGRWAYLAAARAGIDAAAALYGLGISQHLGELGSIKCPLQLHYGMQDQHVPVSEIETVASGVSGRRNVDVLRYPEAGHSFANPVRPTYDAAATKLAFERIEAMLARM